jgi:hypothetical protein
MAWSRVLVVSAAAVLLGARARAEGPGDAPGKIEDPARVGQPGGGAEGTRARGPYGGRELAGKLVKAESTIVYLEHMGAIVALRVDENTRFSGEGVKSSRDLREGQEVRASFTVKGTTNVADKIAVEPASGGRPDGTAPDRSPAPRDPGIPPPAGPGGPSLPKY